MNQHIAGEPHQYCAWPSVVAMPTGELVVSYCNTEEHMAPAGSIHVVVSADRGESWSSPIVACDSLLDDREAGLTLLRDGRLLLHVWSAFHSRDSYSRMPEDAYPTGVVERWTAHVAGPAYRAAEPQRGGWVYQSWDAGRTWFPAGRGPDSIHGGVHLSDGRVLVAAYREGGGTITLQATTPSADSKELDWQTVSAVECPETAGRSFGEPHIAELPTGRIVVMIRTTKKQPYDDGHDDNYLWVSYSDDGAATWSKPCRTDLWGFPPHLLVLRDGRLLCTYGYRRPPFGERACISDDGVVWDPLREIVIRDDAPNGDLGYPHSVEVDAGRILTVYYRIESDDPADTAHPPDPCRRKASIVGTYWDLPAR